MRLLLDSYTEGSPTLQRPPGERVFNRAKVLSLLCANRHREADVLVCEHVHTSQPSAPPHNTHRRWHTDVESEV